jgi:hypothetical protein
MPVPFWERSRKPDQFSNPGGVGGSFLFFLVDPPRITQKEDI